MAKIKLTKTELKNQQDALKQYSRFLPTLQLKKQQLQMEMRRSRALVEANRTEFAALRESLSTFVGLYSSPGAQQFILDNLKVREVRKGESNIAGVTVPVFTGVDFEETKFDLFAADYWYTAGIEAVKQLLSLREAGKVLEEQYRLLGVELTTTTQRVNLFEKVKIPECKENIRRIQISMGDERTAAVVRSKIAKRKMKQPGEEAAA